MAKVMDIVATGMVCSVGLTAASACAAMRAKVAKFDELPYADNRGEPIVGAMVPGLDPSLTRRQRLVEMLAMALEDCLETGGVKHTERIPLLVGLAEPGRPGGGETWAATIIKDVEARLDVRFDPKRSTVIARGHTAGFEGLKMARELLKIEAVPACLVCGVDSYINASSLLWLDRHDRLKTEENADGVIPGEAAACVLVVRSETQPRNECVTRVIGLGFAKEEATILTDEPLLGIGLAQASQTALAESRLGMHQIDLRLADVTGEQYGFKELTLAQQRLMRQRREDQALWHPADSIGDSGAAAGLVGLAVARAALAKGYTPGSRIILSASSADGARSTTILEGVCDGA